MNMEERLNRVATLNAIADEIFERIPMEERLNLDDMEKCLDILQQIEAIKKTL